MLSEHLEREQQLAAKQREAITHSHEIDHQENMLGALALLLGPETEDTLRVQAVRRLARSDAAQIPVLLRALSSYPEITAPPWPWWPPQYTHCGRLLLRISRRTQIPLTAFLQHPALRQPAGPVLWISVIEAISMLPPAAQTSYYELLLATGLTPPWDTVRYAAAMALAELAGQVSLRPVTVEALHTCQDEARCLPVLLATSYALLRNQEDRGLYALLRLLRRDVPEEGRKAAAFVLAIEQPLQLSSKQYERLTARLLLTLQDPNEEVAQHAAHALRTLGRPDTLRHLCLMLQPEKPSHVLIAILIALEEMMSRPAMREAMQSELLTHIVPLLHSEASEVRQQASYTLATIGGTYVTAILGAIVSNSDHPAYLETIEALRLLYHVLHSSVRTNVVRWLLSCLHSGKEKVQITVLDTLAYIAWQAQVHGQKKALLAYSSQIEQEGILEQLLIGPNAWVRQRTIELLGLLDCQQPTLYFQLLHCLHSDEDSGVRACAAYVLGQVATHRSLLVSLSPIPHLILALADTDEHVTETALNTLAQLASAADPFVVFALRELAAYGQVSVKEDNLAQAAQALLKKWHLAR